MKTLLSGLYFLALALVFLVSFLFAQSSFAAEGGHDDPARRAHAVEQWEKVEDHSSHLPGVIGKLHKFAKSLNPFNVRTNMTRLYQTHDNADIRSNLNDILYIWQFSHPGEMAVAPYLTTMAVQNDWGFLGTALSSSTVAFWFPGLDPGCLIFVGAYGASHLPYLSAVLYPYRMAVHYGRRLTWHEARAMSRAAGIPAAFQATFKATPRMENVLAEQKAWAASGKLNVLSLIPGEGQNARETIFEYKAYDFNLKTEVVVLKLVFENEVDHQWLKEVQFSTDPELLTSQQVRSFMEQFGWNVGGFVNEAVKLREKLSSKPDKFYKNMNDRFYVDNVRTRDGEVSIVLKAGSVRPGDARSLRNPLAGALESLKSYSPELQQLTPQALRFHIDRYLRHEIKQINAMLGYPLRSVSGPELVLRRDLDGNLRMNAEAGYFELMTYDADRIEMKRPLRIHFVKEVDGRHYVSKLERLNDFSGASREEIEAALKSFDGPTRNTLRRALAQNGDREILLPRFQVAISERWQLQTPPLLQAVFDACKKVKGRAQARFQPQAALGK